MSKVQNISTNQSLIFDIKDSEVSDNTLRKKEFGLVIVPRELILEIKKTQLKL